MKLFKIIFFSIISILIFQSQIYGINLTCDFKQRLNDRELNVVKCGVINNPICNIKESDELQGWVSEVIILDGDVVVINEPPDFLKPKSTQKQLRRWKESSKINSKVESILHHTFENEKLGVKKDSYIILFQSVSNPFSLSFDTISKNSILIKYVSLNKEGLPPIVYTESQFGESEIE